MRASLEYLLDFAGGSHLVVLWDVRRLHLVLQRQQLGLVDLADRLVAKEHCDERHGDAAQQDGGEGDGTPPRQTCTWWWW